MKFIVYYFIIRYNKTKNIVKQNIKYRNLLTVNNTAEMNMIQIYYIGPPMQITLMSEQLFVPSPEGYRS